jgi:hypothetical protein
MIAASYGQQRPLDLKFELSRVSCVKIEKEVFHLDQFKNGTWRLTYTDSLIPHIDRFNRLIINQVEKKIEVWQKDIEGTSGKIRELSLKSIIKTGSEVGMLHIEPDARGNYRILVSPGLINDFKLFDGLLMLREVVKT